MLTLDILYAVLQGLDPSYLTHLDRSWASFCFWIHESLERGDDPLSAFKFALYHIDKHASGIIMKMIREARPVMQLPGLSRRQKEALVALRYAKVASLSHLTQVLARDRSNVFRSLKTLVDKGFALKFTRKDGVYYYAIRTPLQKSVKSEINQLLKQHFEDTSPPLEELINEALTELTTQTMPTTLTTRITAQELTTVTTPG